MHTFPFRSVHDWEALNGEDWLLLLRALFAVVETWQNCCNDLVSAVVNCDDDAITCFPIDAFGLVSDHFCLRVNYAFSIHILRLCAYVNVDHVSNLKYAVESSVFHLRTPLAAQVHPSACACLASTVPIMEVLVSRALWLEVYRIVPAWLNAVG